MGIVVSQHFQNVLNSSISRPENTFFSESADMRCHDNLRVIVKVCHFGRFRIIGINSVSGDLPGIQSLK